jgi:uncharacterized membrane-anchored protein YhcB (DUF1043 family)
MGNMANEAVLMVPGLGQVVGAVEEAGNVVMSVENAAESLAKISKAGTDTISNLEEQKQEATSLFGKSKQLFENAIQEANSGVSGVIDSSQKYVDDYGKKMNEYNPNNLYKQEQEQEQSGGGKTIKRYHNYAKMIGGRVERSKMEFLKNKTVKRRK